MVLQGEPRVKVEKSSCSLDYNSGGSVCSDMDPELQAIREARLAQLKNNSGVPTAIEIAVLIMVEVKIPLPLVQLLQISWSHKL